MKKFKNKPHNEEEYWKSFTDIMAALLLVIILIMALLFLYLTQLDDNTNDGAGVNDASTDSRIVPTYHAPTTSYYPSEHRVEDQHGGGGGGGTGETQAPTETPTEGGEDIAKAAVFVTVVDEETGNAIKEAGTTFELYTGEDRHGGLKKLCTYYPYKIEYSKYETTENGTFYLPEKIPLGTYSLHSLIVPDTYGAGENVNFEIEEGHDWSDPYYVEFPLAPAKNTIRVVMKDEETGESVSGYTYEVLANEDIITLDGTLRYTKDEIVDEFTCSEKGFGESKKLYLGNYRIRQKSAAEYYALNRNPIDVAVETNEGVDTPVNTITCQKTKLELHLTDEFDGAPISEAVYSVKGGDDIRTDSSGTATLTDLSKDMTYELTLESLPDNYQSEETSLNIYVDEDGLIEGQAIYTVDQTAFVTRLTVSVKDRLLQNNIEGANITVYDEDGTVVANLDINGVPETVKGLKAGKYFIESGGRESTRITAQVNDSAKPTEGVIYLWTTLDFVLIFAAILLLAIIVLITFIIIRKRRGK